MNCSEFDRRLQQQLDQRQRPDGDPELAEHLTTCDVCRGNLAAWQRIERVLPSIDQCCSNHAIDRKSTYSACHPRSRRRAWTAVAVTVAVAAMLVLMVRQGDVDSRVDVPQSEPATVVAQANANVNPSLWWHTVQDRDWVEQTMPAVRSVRDGVAPLGRSLIQAVTILATSGEGFVGGGEGLNSSGEERPS